MRVRTAGWVFGLWCLCLGMQLTGCGWAGTDTAVLVETEEGTVEIESSDSGMQLEQTEDGFSVTCQGQTVDGTLISFLDADVLNANAYETDGYSVISVDDQIGFAFSSGEDPVVYSHVIPVADADVSVRLDSTSGGDILYTVESALTFTGKGE